jgi:YD repeat-containing protein
VTLNGNLAILGSDSSLIVENGLTLNGTIILDDLAKMPYDPPAMLCFRGSQLLDGSGQIVMRGSYVQHHADFGDMILIEQTDGAATLTVGAGITISGQGQIASTTSGNKLENYGTIRAGIVGADGSPGTLAITGGLPEGSIYVTAALINQGTLIVEGDSVLNVERTVLRGQLTGISDMELYLAWGGLTGGADTTYTLYQSTDGTNYSWLATLTAADSSFLFSGLARNTAYALRIVAQDADGAKRIYDGGLVATSDTPNATTWYKLGSITNDVNGTLLSPSGDNVTVDTSWVYADSPAGAILQLVHSLVTDCSAPTQAPDGTWKVYHVVVTDDTYSLEDPKPLFDGYTFDKSLYPSGAYSDVTDFTPFTIGFDPEDTPPDPPCEPDQDDPCKDKDKCQTGSDAINANGAGVGIGKVGTSVVSDAGTFSASAIDSTSSGTTCCGGGTGGLAYSSLNTSFDSGYGPGWNDADELPMLLVAKNMVAARFGAEQFIWFDAHSDGTYSARYGSKQTLVHDSAQHLFILTKTDGTIYEFFDGNQTDHPQGGLCRSVDPSGTTIIVTGWTQAGVNGRIAEVEYRTTPTGQAYQRRVFTYVTTGDGVAHVASQTLSEYNASRSTWTNVRKITYGYYATGESYGLAGDLKTITTQQWNATVNSGAGDWTGNDTYYYRYYTTSGNEHLLERVLLPAAYAKFVSAYGDPADSSNTNSGDLQTDPIANYTCFYYEYDASRRVSKTVLFGKSNGTGYESTLSTNLAGYNGWERKTVETRLDGSTNTVYTNYLGQTLLTDLYDPQADTHTITYNRYDNDGHLVLTAHPSAFVAVDDMYYDESLADLISYASGNSPYLSDTAGLFEETVYYATGYVHETAIAQGETAARLDPGSTGGPIVQTHYEYVSQTVGNDTIYRVASQTTYANEDGTGAATTNYTYTWYVGTFQVQEETITLPAVSTTENGSGHSATTREWFDAQGNLVWSMNELGRVTYNQYDSLTGDLQWSIEDIDLATATSLGLTPPTGWTLPTSGGIENTTDYQYDALSRVTQTLGTAHLADVDGTMTLVRTATWTIYHDADHQTWTAQGYVVVATQTAVIVGPVSITKTDLDGRVTEQIQATWSDTLAELQVASAATAFPQSSYVAWTTIQYANTRVVSTRVYHDIPSSGVGTAGVNYEQTSYGYETFGTSQKGRQNKTVAADGTITRVVLDARGNVLETWMGTDDTGATDRDPTGNRATGNNMVKVSSATYDADGNLIESRAYFGDGTSDYYATTYQYDWRDRLTDTLSPANVVTHYDYDNLGRTLCTQIYASADFALAASELRAQTETFYNDRGQVYESIVYEVAQQDATTPGQVLDHLITNSWYDAAGNLIKSQTGAGTFTKTQYDGLGRATVQYLGYDIDETIADLYDANGNAQLALVGDTIIQQTQTWYDQASQYVATATYERLPNDTTAGALTAANSYATASVTWYDGLGRSVASASYGREDASSGLTHYFFNGTTGDLIDANADGLPDVAQNAPPQPYTSQNTSSLAGVDFQLQLVEYDAAGRAYRTLDNLGRINETQYDDAGRTVRTIQNYQNGTVEETDTDQDITVDYQYDSAGRLATMTTYNAKGTGNGVQAQATKYLHTSAVNASWQTAAVYADSTDVLSQDSTTKVWTITTNKGDHTSTTYDRLGRTTSSTDQRGVVHEYTYDSAGRVSADTVTSLGLADQNVDGTIRRIGTAYDDVGRVRTVTSYGNTAGTVVSNQVYDRYDGWGNLAQEWQSHTGVVDTASTPSVQYVYDDGVAAGVANGEAKYVRLTDVIYPNGRDVQYGYGEGEAGAIDDVMSRLATIGDQNGTYAAYTYLGAGKIVTEDYVEAQAKLDYAHDNLAGFDRFGRVVDQLWQRYGDDPAVLDEYTYTYDRAGNRTGRTNELNDDLSETYGYNDLDELVSSTREDDTSESWTLDGLGNWSEYTDDGTTETRTTKPDSSGDSIRNY